VFSIGHSERSEESKDSNSFPGLFAGLLMTKKSIPNIGVFLLGMQSKKHASMAGWPFFEMDQSDASATSNGKVICHFVIG
jgi:hypothetical protein